MILSQPRRRPAQLAAAAVLLLLHLAAIDLLLSLKSTRERPTEGLVTLMLSAFAKPTPRESPVKAAAPVTRRRAAPTPAPARDRIHEPAPPAAEAPAAPAPPVAPEATADTPPGKPAPLELGLSKDFFDKEREHERHLSPAEEAQRDPRSNKLVLTKQEQIEIDFGQYECIAWQREPDGSIYRGPGHLKKVLNIPMGGKTIFECVK